MCAIAALPIALSAASAVTGFMGQQKATDDYNAQAAAAQRDARIAAENKYKDVGSKYVWDIKDLNQKGYKAALNAREEQAKGVASAGAMGIAPGSNTLNNLIAQSRQIAANNEANVQSKREEAHDTLLNNDQTIQSEAQQRINSIPFKSGPNPLSLVLGIASSAVGGQQPSIPGISSAGSTSIPGINMSGFFSNQKTNLDMMPNDI